MKTPKRTLVDENINFDSRQESEDECWVEDKVGRKINSRPRKNPFKVEKFRHSNRNLRKKRAHPFHLVKLLVQLGGFGRPNMLADVLKEDISH